MRAHTFSIVDVFAEKKYAGNQETFDEPVTDYVRT